jgi:hypothetical protein
MGRGHAPWRASRTATYQAAAGFKGGDDGGRSGEPVYVGHELVDRLGEVGVVGDVVPLEDRLGTVPGDRHGRLPRDAGAGDVADAGPPEIVEELPGEARLLAGALGLRALHGSPFSIVHAPLCIRGAGLGPAAPPGTTALLFGHPRVRVMGGVRVVPAPCPRSPRTTAIFTLNRVWKPARLMLIARVVSGNN